MENQKSEIKKGSPGWIIAGFVFALLGGLIGLIIGMNYAFGRYDQSTKNYGYAMIVIGAVMTIIWRGLVA